MQIIFGESNIISVLIRNDSSPFVNWIHCFTTNFSYGKVMFSYVIYPCPSLYSFAKVISDVNYTCDTTHTSYHQFIIEPFKTWPNRHYLTCQIHTKLESEMAIFSIDQSIGFGHYHGYVCRFHTTGFYFLTCCSHHGFHYMTKLSVFLMLRNIYFFKLDT